MIIAYMDPERGHVYCDACETRHHQERELGLVPFHEEPHVAIDHTDGDFWYEVNHNALLCDQCGEYIDIPDFLIV